MDSKDSEELRLLREEEAAIAKRVMQERDEYIQKLRDECTHPSLKCFTDNEWKIWDCDICGFRSYS